MIRAANSFTCFLHLPSSLVDATLNYLNFDDLYSLLCSRRWRSIVDSYLSFCLRKWLPGREILFSFVRLAIALEPTPSKLGHLHALPLEPLSDEVALLLHMHNKWIVYAGNRTLYKTNF